MSKTVQRESQPLVRHRLAWQLGAASLMSVLFVIDRLTTPGYVFSAADAIALVGSGLAGWWTARFFVRRVKDNLYYEQRLKRVYVVAVAVLGITLVSIAHERDWDAPVLAHPATVTAALWYFWTVLFALLWLNRYERDHGPVRIFSQGADG